MEPPTLQSEIPTLTHQPHHLYPYQHPQSILLMHFTLSLFSPLSSRILLGKDLSKFSLNLPPLPHQTNSLVRNRHLHPMANNLHANAIILDILAVWKSSPDEF